MKIILNYVLKVHQSCWSSANTQIQWRYRGSSKARD